MLNLSRLLVLIVVALVAARPVMACCLTGHGGSETVGQVEVSAPPCHDMTPKAEHDGANVDQEPASLFECPGCLDCDTSIVQAQSINDGALLAQSSSEFPLAILTARFPGFEHKPLTLKTGPPGDPTVPFHTPITLKQRLLI